MSQESERTQRRQVGASLSWALAGQAARRGGNLLTSLILAQILLPSEIGTFTIPFTVAMFLLALNDLGIGYAVIRHRGDVNEVAPTAVTLAVTSSFTAWMGVIVFAPQIVDLFSSPQNPAPDNAVLFVRLLAVVIVFDGLTMVPGSALTRELREKDRTLCELGGFGATMTTSISVAVAGGGAWALVLGQIVGVTVTAALMIWRSPAKPRPGWDTKVAKGLVSFGLPLAGAGILNQAILNADYVIVNRYLGTDVAGAYFFAFNISNWPVTLVSLAMRRTAMASFSRLQHDLAALRRAFGNAVELLVTVTLPMAALIGTLAEEVITVLFPDEYLIGVIALRFLAAISVVRLLYQLCTDAIAALGRTTTILVVQGLWLGTLVPFMIIGASNWELTGLGVAQFASALGVALPILLWRLATLGFHIGPLAARLVRPLLGTAGLVATAFLVHELGGPAIVRLIVGGIAGLAVYAAIVLPRSDVLPQVLSLVGRGPLASTPAGAEPPAGAGGPVDGHLTDTSRPTVPTPDAAGSRTARR
ncbi:MAG: oligosaccharide flippase family protein, partial [Actinomycetota bacterium]|nr:oligosaccharide flippase family protein [Actinomycetota bacterium]